MPPTGLVDRPTLLPDRVHGTPKGDGTTGTRYVGLGRLGSVRTTVGSVRIPDRKPPLPTRVVVVVVGGRVVVVVDVVEGHLNGPHVNAQLMSPTSHCAILRASSMLQAPSPLTSQASGWMSWLHWRSPTSNSATANASPMLTIPSPFTSPQVWMVAVPETAGVCWKTCPGETPGLPAGFWQTPTPACLQRPSTFFRHTRGRPPTPMHTPILSRHARRHCRAADAASAAGAT